ncbi:MAG TPA: hypothetical protein VFJ16_12495, partial [Longimicrobium sp.]|nr:hypothetical protein [Longimicrobium sp.]
APFRLQFCMNGHNWLASRLKRHRIGYQLLDNAFIGIDDFQRAQQIADSSNTCDTSPAAPTPCGPPFRRPPALADRSIPLQNVGYDGAEQRRVHAHAGRRRAQPRPKSSLGQKHTDLRPTGATTNASDRNRRDPMHGSVSQEQSTNTVEAKRLKRQRREEGTASPR